MKLRNLQLVVVEADGDEEPVEYEVTLTQYIDVDSIDVNISNDATTVRIELSWSVIRQPSRTGIIVAEGDISTSFTLDYELEYDAALVEDEIESFVVHHALADCWPVFRQHLVTLQVMMGFVPSELPPRCPDDEAFLDAALEEVEVEFTD